MGRDLIRSWGNLLPDSFSLTRALGDDVTTRHRIAASLGSAGLGRNSAGLRDTLGREERGGPARRQAVSSRSLLLWPRVLEPAVLKQGI